MLTPKSTVLLLSLTLAISTGRPLLGQESDLASRSAALEEGQSVTDRGITLTLHRKSAGTPDSAGWYPAMSTGCGFSVLLPAPYDDLTSSAIDPAGGVLERHVLSSTTADGARFSVVCMDSNSLTDPFIYPEQYVLNLAAGDRILRKVAITLGDLSGLEVSAVFSSFTPSRLPSTPKPPDAGAGQQVVARIASLEPKSYTDHFAGDWWSIVVSDVFVLAVLEPPELAGITVDAYYQGRPVLDGHLLSVGDVVGFQLPSKVKRLGILLWDLQDLRLLRPSSQQPKPEGH